MHELTVVDVQPARSVFLIGSEVAVDFDEPAEKPSAATLPTALTLNSAVEGQVPGNGYVYYELKNNPSMDAVSVVFELQTLSGDADVLVSQSSSRPSLLGFQWSALRTGGERVVVRPDDELRVKASFWVAVRGHREAATFRLAAFLEEPVTAEELLESSGIQPVKSVLAGSADKPAEDSVRCGNCAVWLPPATAFRHEAFCKRNVTRCEQCQALVQNTQRDFHWHCPVCSRLKDKADHFHCDTCKRSFNKAKFEKHVHWCGSFR